MAPLSVASGDRSCFYGNATVTCALICQLAVVAAKFSSPADTLNESLATINLIGQWTATVPLHSLDTGIHSQDSYYLLHSQWMSFLYLDALLAFLTCLLTRKTRPLDRLSCCTSFCRCTLRPTVQNDRLIQRHSPVQMRRRGLSFLTSFFPVSLTKLFYLNLCPTLF